jgi:purine-nucleoside phosphorylase
LDGDPWGLADRAAAVLAERTGTDHHDTLVVLGSGWSTAADRMGDAETEVSTAELPGFPTPTVQGHLGVLRSLRIADRRVLVSVGRVHLYEGHPPATVVHAVRTAAAAGCRTVVLSNAAGSLRPEWPAGSAVLIADQINATGVSPLTGAPRFVDLTDMYSPRLRTIVTDLAPGTAEGIYLGLHGPEFESPAEIVAYRTWGADLVGMSTVLEAIAARHAGMEVCGLALVTNLAAGMRPAGLDVAEVFSVGDAAAGALGDLLAALVARA